MKLACYHDGSRDGQLVVVSKDLTQAHYATHIAHRLQQVLDDWNYLAPALEEVYTQLNHGHARHAFAFDPAMCQAPMSRVYQCLQGDAYPSHRHVVAQAQGHVDGAASLPWSPVAQGVGDDLRGPHAEIACINPAWQLDFAVNLAVITGEVPLGCSPDRALDAVRLLALANHTLRRHDPAQPTQAWTPFQQHLATAWAPVVVTPDEVRPAWDQGRLHLQVQTTLNGRKVGMCDLGDGMQVHFGALLAHAAVARRLRSGTLLLSGTVSHAGVVKGDRTQWPQGYCSIAEKRGMEVLLDGQAQTAYLAPGDTLRVEVKGPQGASMFGAIAQEVVEVAAQSR
ncbi:MAG: fumarylacetoacetate hydrolase family protein [Rhodoferax sp.]|nr:fumarylacetoacetate hydrolase family protein [Rhodoferax sp.]